MHVRVAIVGAGVAGLANARVLTDAGDDVVVYERQADVGGVWSASRAYPGLRTQNDKRTYAFSDRRLPSDAAEYPTAEAVQAYLADFARRHGLTPSIRLGTAVERIARDGDGWLVTATGPDGTATDRVDRVVIANGAYSTPNLPDVPGAVPSVGVHLGTLRDRDVVVIGWGKTAADIAMAALPVARSVAVVARRIGWKLPARVGRVPFQRLTISRLGEHLLWAPHRTLAGRVLRRVDAPLRAAFLRGLEARVRRQQHLDAAGLVPDERLDHFTHLETPGFLAAVAAGRIALRREGTPTEPGALVIAATGFDQDLSFLDPATLQQLLEPDGTLRLYRHTLPQRVSGLVVAGWTNSFRSPICSEVQALWIAALLHGRVRLPPQHRRWRYEQTLQLTHARAAAHGRPQFSAGASILDQDAWIREACLRLPLRVVLRELLRPIDPADYAVLHEQLARRLGGAPDSSVSADGQRTASV